MEQLAQVTFSVTESLFRSGTNHGHDEPPHLRLRNPSLPAVVNLPMYAGPESRYCPAGVVTLLQAQSTKKLEVCACAVLAYLLRLVFPVIGELPLPHARAQTLGESWRPLGQTCVGITACCVTCKCGELALRSWISGTDGGYVLWSYSNVSPRLQACTSTCRTSAGASGCR